MRVVSDTSPLSCLASLDRLDLIERQFRGSVMVPHAVEQELLRHPDPQALGRLKFAFAEGVLRVREIERTSLTRILANTLDAGEVQAIALALAEKADWLLIDEREGRQAARSLGLPITGTLGILM